MKVSDLMIGDWVICNDLKRPVAAIGETVGFLDCNNQVYWAYEGFDRIDYIPLTEDILVKNGFELENKIEDDCLTYRYGNFHLFYYPDGTGLYSYNSQIVIGSVHQLQHLLRLAGVQKEIEL